MVNTKDRVIAIQYARNVVRLHEAAPTTEANLLVSLLGETLYRSLTKPIEEEFLPSRALLLPDGQDCRSRYTRRLAFALLGDDAASQAEKCALDDRNATFTGMGFYERLIAEMSGS